MTDKTATLSSNPNDVLSEVRETYSLILKKAHDSTHYVDCWKDHWPCVLERALDEIDRLAQALAASAATVKRLSDETQSALQPGEDIAEALERRGDALSVRAARHIRIKWNTEEGLRQQLRRTNDQLNESPLKANEGQS
jgi:hypothetical protein